ncbi:hypothetical protein VTK26DRAFT_4131 [Humicola hyalothermophila]
MTSALADKDLQSKLSRPPHYPDAQLPNADPNNVAIVVPTREENTYNAIARAAHDQLRLYRLRRERTNQIHLFGLPTQAARQRRDRVAAVRGRGRAGRAPPGAARAARPVHGREAPAVPGEAQDRDGHRCRCRELSRAARPRGRRPPATGGGHGRRLHLLCRLPRVGQCVHGAVGTIEEALVLEAGRLAGRDGAELRGAQGGGGGFRGC